ncbi:hypothetical protein GCK72_003621 [Caenorhabditis remanei]|uniref:Uncharacterized protein n=1 Tax=Caenorhabditis remanei TaxID=31234 RepID=A0A6A5H9X8_CAERE|nr:hypothetical protein GCK72_003621 [Caenorhabditis remanei]KAF1763676.1 hypothetical protein GCK72_003621 [Caenorhabditis remanei]
MQGATEVYDFRSTLNRHEDGYFIARVVVGLMKVADKKEVMILIDPCLTNDDNTEPVVHFAITGDQLEHRFSGEFQKIEKLGNLEPTRDAQLIQVAVGTWEYQTSASSIHLCNCHPNFYEPSANHSDLEICEMRLLAGCIATHLRMNGNLLAVTIQSGLSILN